MNETDKPQGPYFKTYKPTPPKNSFNKSKLSQAKKRVSKELFERQNFSFLVFKSRSPRVIPSEFEDLELRKDVEL